MNQLTTTNENPTMSIGETEATFRAALEQWDAAQRPALVAMAEAAKAISIDGHAYGREAGYTAADTMRKRLKQRRCDIAGDAKFVGSELRKLATATTDAGERLIEIIAPEEDRLANEVTAYEQERVQARLRAAEEAGVRGDIDLKIANDGADSTWERHLAAKIEVRRAAEERKALRDSLLSEAREAGATLEDIGDIDALPDIPEEEWAARVHGWRDRTAAREEAARLEQERLEAERIERERLEAEARETARQHEIALAEERRRQDEERAELNRQAEESRRIAEEAKREADAAKAELQRIQDEQKAEADRKAREEQEAQARADKDAADAAAAALREAQRPDREKIAAWCRVAAGSITAPPEIADASLRAALEGCHLDILNRINLLATETQESA